jgi:uncharacterized membrane protein
MNPEFLITILGMAVILYAMRIGGYILISRIPSSPLLDAWLEQIPGATLVALVIPMVVREGIIGLVAGRIVWIVVIRTENLVLAMAVGVAIVALPGAPPG